MAIWNYGNSGLLLERDNVIELMINNKRTLYQNRQKMYNNHLLTCRTYIRMTNWPTSLMINNVRINVLNAEFLNYKCGWRNLVYESLIMLLKFLIFSLKCSSLPVLFNYIFHRYMLIGKRAYLQTLPLYKISVVSNYDILPFK